MSKRCQNVKEMSQCQRDVKMSKRCQMSKSQTHGLCRRFTEKINSHNEVHTYWCQFWCQIWRSPKLFKNTFYAHLRVFGHHHMWRQNWRQYLWTSLCQFIFFVNLLHSPCVWLFDIWHLFDNLTSFWQLDIFFDIWAMGNVGKWVSWLIPKIEMGHLGGWGTWGMGQWATWSMWSYAWSCAASLKLHGSLQKFYCT